MRLSNKYNVPQEAIDKMIDDGLIGCQWRQYEKIYEEFQMLHASNSCKGCLYMDLSIKHKLSERTIKDIVLKMGKI